MSLQKLGRYDLIRVLGKGAMGLVYEGRDPNLNRRVAIKTIKVDNLSDVAADEYEVRFRTEAHSAARLQHPNIVSVYDSDRDGDMAFLVLEFVEGNDLKHHLDMGEVFTLGQTLGIMSDLLSALAYAHKQKIVHRDIKPANLLVQANGRIKLADFGVARIQDSGDATRTQGSIVGTLKYMSPEQLEGRPIDARADLFAAGVVLYQLLTSKRPFDGDTDFAVIQNIVSLTPVAVAQHNPGLPLALNAVVAKAMAKSRDERYASADEFADALALAGKEAADLNVVPPQPVQVKGSATTWSRTVVSGESLVGTRANLGTEAGTLAHGALLAQELELLYWKDIGESDDPADYKRFLQKFPAGIYVDLARRKLKLLGSASGNAARGSAAAPASKFTVAAELPMFNSSFENSRIANVSAFGQTAVKPPRSKTKSAPSHPKNGVAASKSTGKKKTSRAAWVLLGLAAAALGVSALKMLPAGTPAVTVAGTASAPLSAASAASAVLGLGPGETAVVSFGADAPLAKPSAAAPGAVQTASQKASGANPFETLLTGAPDTATPSSSTAAGLASSAASGASFAAATGTIRAPLSPASAAQRQAAAAARAAASAARRGGSAPVSVAVDQSAQKSGTPTDAPVVLKKSAAAASANGGSPASACEGRVLIGFQICMREQCAKPAFAQSALCIERRQMEDRRREADKAG